MSEMSLDIFGNTHQGQVRSENQDSIFFASDNSLDVGKTHLKQNGYLIAVADGVGGLVGGKEASSLIIENLVGNYYQEPIGNTQRSLRHAIIRANSQAHESVSTKDGSTTLVCAVIRNNQLHVANVGDSRAYLIRNGKIKQLTEDQTLNGRLVNYLVSLEDAQPELMPVVRLQQEDRILLCSDGLYRAVPEMREITEAIIQMPPEEAVEHLIERANENGGPDNISIIVAHVKEGKARASRIPRRMMAMIGAICSLLLIALMVLSWTGVLGSENDDPSTNTNLVVTVEATESFVDATDDVPALDGEVTDIDDNLQPTDAIDVFLPETDDGEEVSDSEPLELVVETPTVEATRIVFPTPAPTGTPEP